MLTSLLRDACCHRRHSNPRMLNHNNFFEKCRPFMKKSEKFLALQVVEKYESHLAKMASDKPLALLEVGYGIFPSVSFKQTLEDTLEKKIYYTGIETKAPQSHLYDTKTDPDETVTKNSKYERGSITFKIRQHGDVFDNKENNLSNYDVIIVRNIEPSIIERLVNKLMSSARNGAVIVITAASFVETMLLYCSLTRKSNCIEFVRVSNENQFSYIHKNYPNYQPDCNMFVIKVNRHNNSCKPPNNCRIL